MNEAQVLSSFNFNRRCIGPNRLNIALVTSRQSQTWNIYRVWLKSVCCGNAIRLNASLKSLCIYDYMCTRMTVYNIGHSR